MVVVVGGRVVVVGGVVVVVWGAAVVVVGTVVVGGGAVVVVVVVVVVGTFTPLHPEPRRGSTGLSALDVNCRTSTWVVDPAITRNATSVDDMNRASSPSDSRTVAVSIANRSSPEQFSSGDSKGSHSTTTSKPFTDTVRGGHVVPADAKESSARPTAMTASRADVAA